MSSKYKIRLKKGDSVVVRSGKYKGKTGKVEATHPSTNKVTISGINVVKRHSKPTKSNPQGGIIEITKPIAVSKVGAYEPTLKRASRIHYQITSGKKVRMYTKSSKEMK